MNMIYKENKLFVELEEVNRISINSMKERLFNLLNNYEIRDIVIDVYGIFDLDKSVFHDFIDEFHSKYNGNITIINK